jgi:hypothetical protein
MPTTTREISSESAYVVLSIQCINALVTSKSVAPFIHRRSVPPYRTFLSTGMFYSYSSKGLGKVSLASRMAYPIPLGQVASFSRKLVTSRTREEENKWESRVAAWSES